ncbi:TIR domain-containing protein [Lentzea sp. NPDC058436]|uniref:TIR domain-containing protein n=1 Tax=Lentzea sp. NPDC058436 TaxID=3346499 RepID=UPI00364E9258
MQEYEFDVALSFADHDRMQVLPIMQRLEDLGVRVYSEEDRLVEGWGLDLVDLIVDTLNHKVRYVLMFISRHYVGPEWSRRELLGARTKALAEQNKYVLPVRLDDSEVPGLVLSMGYLDLRVHNIELIAQAVVQKLAQHRSGFTSPVLVTPRTVEALVREKPSGWEYLLYTRVVLEGISELENKYHEHFLRYAPRNDRVEHGNGLDLISDRGVRLDEIITVAMARVFAPEAQQIAFGPPGMAGNASRIIHFGELFVQVFDEILNWARDIHGTSYADPNARDVAYVQARFADQPLQTMRGLMARLRDVADTLVERFAAGEKIDLTLPLVLEVDHRVEEELRDAVAQLSASGVPAERARASEYEFDVATSFAGEDREEVLPIVRRLKELHVRVFYDEDFTAELWGVNLVDHLPKVYGQSVRFVLLFVSKNYVGPTKKWTKVERQAAQARAVELTEEYLLPIRLDDTEVPGLSSSVVYLDRQKYSVEDIAQTVVRKLAKITGGAN